MNWMKKKALALTAALSMSTLTPAVMASDLTEIAAATVHFTSNGGKVCSAVVIPGVKTGDAPRVATAKHCAPTEQDGVYGISIPTFAASGQMIAEQRYALGKPEKFGKRDVTVLEFVAPETLPDDLVTADVTDAQKLTFGDPLMHVGFPTGTQPENDGTHPTVTDGRFHEYTFVPNSPTLIRTDVVSWYGGSGGGLWAETGEDEYELVGLTSSGDVSGAPWLFIFYSPVTIETLR